MVEQEESPVSQLLAMEAAMREEIRELHEQRAAAMMLEIVELQKERDLAVAKLKWLEKKVKDLESEAKTRERRCEESPEGRGQLVELLRRSLVEEQLLSADLKHKLQSMKKENTSLAQQLREVPSHPSTSHPSSPHPSSPHPSSPHPSTGGQSPSLPLAEGYSPTVVPRRYKLASVTSREASTQTPDIDQSEHSSAQDINQSEHSSAEALSPSILEALTTSRADIVRLQRERDEEKVLGAEKRRELKKESESLQLECGVLHEALREFSRWVRGKLEGMEETMVIFKVIYSLHGSLSQEQSVLKELQQKLKTAEVKAVRLDHANKQLRLTVSESDEKYQHSLTQIRTLQDRLLSCPPPSSHLPPPPHSLSSSHAMRKFSSPQLPLRHSVTSLPMSPLTTHTPSPPHTSRPDVV